VNLEPRRAGRPPMIVTMTIAELAGILGLTPSAVSKRIEPEQASILDRIAPPAKSP
jgi:DNA-binding Lrp family transcriptional regulator